MSIDHCGADIRVTQEFLNSANVISLFEQMSRKRMAKRMAAGIFGDSRSADCRFDGSLDARFIEMVSAHFPAEGVDGSFGSGEDVLPVPLFCCRGIFVSERVGQDRFTVAVGEVFLVDSIDFFEVELESFLNGLGEDGRAIFFAFTLSHGYSILFEIDILDAQAKAFEEAESGAVEDIGDDPVDAGKVGDDEFGLGAGECDGDAFRAVSPDDIGDRSKFSMENLRIEKENGVERQILSRCCDFFIDGEVCQKFFDFFFRHIFRMSFLMKENESFYPVGVCVLGAA